MDGTAQRPDNSDVAAELRSRLSRVCPDRLGLAVGLIVEHVLALVDGLQPTEADLDALLHFLTDVGYATDARRQEWVLLADVFGLSAMIAELGGRPGDGGTPSTLPGPFYRDDAPLLKPGANLCRDGVGTPLDVAVVITDPAGAAVPGAMVEVWQANGNGRYENQDPDNQPEHNLRGRFPADAAGRLRFSTVRPAGYALPDDGPVGKLARRLGLSLDRPAHIHFAVTAPGFRRLVTTIFDGADPAIARDPLFAVRAPLIAEFPPVASDGALRVSLVLTRSAPAPLSETAS